MALEREPSVFRAHPLAIVLHPDEALAALLDQNLNPARAGVDGVFDELLDDRCWPLDDFTRRNLIGEIGRQKVDVAHADQ